MTGKTVEDLGALVSLLTITRESGIPKWRELTGEWNYGKRWPYLEFVGASDVSQGRSELASIWLAEHKTQWALWLDDDLELEWGQLVSFAEAAIMNADRLDLMAGVYVPKAPRSKTVCVLFDEPQNNLGQLGGLRPISACGFGLVMVKRTLFQRVALGLQPVLYSRSQTMGWPFFLGMVLPDPNGLHHHVGEDYAFCARAKRAGGRLFAYTRTRLGHRGPYVYSWEDSDSVIERFDNVTLNAPKRDAFQQAMKEMGNATQEARTGSAGFHRTSKADRRNRR